ncbi:unnamed protein product [Closterium sp. NIES-53]
MSKLGYGESQIGRTLFLHPPDLRTAATHLQQAQLLFEKGTEARQNAAADLAASIGPVAAAGKRLAVAASSSSSAAAAGAAAAGAARVVQWQG